MRPVPAEIFRQARGGTAAISASARRTGYRTTGNRRILRWGTRRSALGARLAARMGMRRPLVLTNGLALFGFLVLTQLPATGGYSSH